jgi:hypothetical protein
LLVCLSASCQMGRHHGNHFHCSLAGRSAEPENASQYIIFLNLRPVSHNLNVGPMSVSVDA